MSSLTNNAHQGDPRYKLTLLGHLLDSEALQSKDEQDQISITSQCIKVDHGK